MKKYLKTYKVMLENSVSYEIQYRKNAWIKLMTNFLWLGMILLTIEIIFTYTPSLSGWE